MALRFSDGTVKYEGRVAGHAESTWNDGFDYARYVKWVDDDGNVNTGECFYSTMDNPGHACDVDLRGVVLAAYADREADAAANRAADAVIARWNSIRKGSRVRLVEPTTRGKYAHITAGTEGHVMWLGPNHYNRWASDEARIGVRLADDEVAWMDTYRWEVALGEDEIPDMLDEAFETAAEHRAARHANIIATFTRAKAA